MTISGTVPSDPASPLARNARYGPLLALSHAGLRKTINPSLSIYDRQLRNARIEPTRSTEDLTSTCICLIGIDRSHTDPERVSLSPQRTLEAAIKLAARRQYDGAIGLLIWANSVIGGIDAEELAIRARLPFSDDSACVASLTTMEVAWLASGLLHEVQRTGSARIRTLAQSVVAALHERYDRGAGLMPHAAITAPFAHRLRGRIANFADQIYTVQAFAFASIALGDDRALERAVRLAQRVVSLQGSLGQWWWHYDSRTGVVAEAYPVYSVHQYAMAPMALMAVEAAGGPSFSGPIQNSHAWLRKNEIGVNMVDFEAETIWRDIRYSNGRVRSLLRKAGTLTGLHRNQEQAHRAALTLNYETRPYEWAWCLYAGAIESRLERRRHLV
jgi:hypothetical protein